MEYMKKADVFEQTSSHDVEQTVKSIIEHVKAGGDDAVREYEKKFGDSDRPVRVSEEEIEHCIRTLPEEVKVLIDRVVERVSDFAKAQLSCLTPFEKDFGEGIKMGHRIVPIEKVGAYVPGGRFPLLSSGPMVVAPAKVAGAKRIVAASILTSSASA